ncbi:MAG TPA: diaminopimelate epimerase [Burkholderiales bacterium]|nr:diaminopimelate epimerase [Burkholderiales bacterium]
MRLKFTKMEGAGNDFMVVDATAQPFRLEPVQIAMLADRHFGVGFDQLLVVEPPRTAGTDFYYRIFNADGGEVAQCGNGARCLVRYVHDKGLASKRAIRVETASGIIEPRLEADGQVTVDMGVPQFDPARIPFVAAARSLTYRLQLDGREVEIAALSMGNPHAVQVVPDVAAAPVATEGPKIEHHPRFPQRVNAGYMQVVDRRHIELRVWERGAGETLACGTGACAAAVSGIARGLLDSPVEVHMRGGMLRVAWAGEGEPVFMTGPARRVFEGEIEVGTER